MRRNKRSKKAELRFIEKKNHPFERLLLSVRKKFIRSNGCWYPFGKIFIHSKGGRYPFGKKIQSFVSLLLFVHKEKKLNNKPCNLKVSNAKNTATPPKKINSKHRTIEFACHILDEIIFHTPSVRKRLFTHQAVATIERLVSFQRLALSVRQKSLTVRTADIIRLNFLLCRSNG